MKLVNNDDKTLFEKDVNSIKLLLEVAVESRAYLRGAYLRGAYLEGANLREANLRGANLEGAHLEGAYLEGAYLEGANLEGANLEETNLEGANLEETNLEGANLEGAYLRGANLRGVNLRGAHLEGANLRGVNLRGAHLEGANLRGVKGLLPIVPEVGAFVAFKKLRGGVVAKLQIPESAGRVGGYTGRKCRAEKAIVLEGSGVSQYNSTFQYAIGEIVTPDSWDPDPRVECSHGIHFFLTRQEAEEFEL